jgi:hypothetical protein
MELPKEYVLLVQVLSEDKKLRDWFETLEKLPDNLRHAELRKMSSKMKADGEDGALISLVDSLNEQGIRDAIRKTLEGL